MNFNPYVGPVPFGTEQRDYFFGRETEAETLLSLAISERVVLFYAQSGAGKSSLINAEIIPRLEKKDYEVLPVVRVGGELPSDLPTTELDNVYVFNTLWCLSKGTRKYKPLCNKSLTSFVNDTLPNKKEIQRWLIFDQMEEILTTYPDQREKRKNFFTQLKHLLEKDFLLSVIMVMREDHIAGLDNYVSLLPGRLSTRFRMERLRQDAAVEAICRPAEKAGRVFAAGVAEHLVRDLSLERASADEKPIPGDYVEPVQLQVVCYNMWKSLDAVKSEDDKIITQDECNKYADVNKALSSFYDDTVEQVAQKSNVPQVKIRRWFGETLITPTKIRAQVNRGLLSSGELPNKAVDLFLAEHLIRVEDARGGKWLELAHDRLITPILESNEKWLSEGATTPLSLPAKKWLEHKQDPDDLLRGRRLQEAQKWYEKNKDLAGPLEKEFLTASAARQAKRSTLLKSAVVVLVILLIGSMAGLVYASSQYFDAQQKFTQASEKQKIADENLEKARIETEDAKIKAEDAGKQTAKAVEEKRLAEDSKVRAEKREKEALLAKEKAMAEQQLAIKQQMIAEDRENEAVNTLERERQAVRDKNLALENLKKSEEEVGEVTKFLRETFIEVGREYAQRLELSGDEPTIIFVTPKNSGISAIWNQEKRQYEVNPKLIRQQGLAEMIAIEGRFLARNFAKCFGKGASSTDDVYWSEFRFSTVDYIVSTEQKKSGEGKYINFSVDYNYRLYQIFTQMQSDLNRNAEPVRKLAIALLDRYQCDWSDANIQENMIRTNRELNLGLDNVIRNAFIKIKKR